jgi:hypothetical protein
VELLACTCLAIPTCLSSEPERWGTYVSIFEELSLAGRILHARNPDFLFFASSVINYLDAVLFSESVIKEYKSKFPESKVIAETRSGFASLYLSRAHALLLHSSNNTRRFQNTQ